MTLFVRPYVAGDARLIPLRAQQSVELSILADGAHYDEALTHAWTLIAGGAPAACAGFVERWEGHAQAWALCGELRGAVGFAFARAVKRAVARATWRRIEATCRMDFPRAAEFLRWLGFRANARLRCYGPDGADHLLFARVREERL